VTKRSKAKLNTRQRIFNLRVAIAAGVLALAAGSILILQSPITKESGRLAALSEHLNYDALLSRLIIRTKGTPNSWCTKILVTSDPFAIDGDDKQQCLVAALDTEEISSTATADIGVDTKQHINTKTTRSVVSQSMRSGHTTDVPGIDIALESNKEANNTGTVTSTETNSDKPNSYDILLAEKKPATEDIPSIESTVADEEIEATPAHQPADTVSQTSAKKMAVVIEGQLTLTDNSTQTNSTQIKPDQSTDTVEFESDSLNSKSFATSLFTDSYQYPLFGLAAEPLANSEQDLESIKTAEQEGLEHDFTGFSTLKNPQPLVVMIDPGHGGSDTGTIGTGGSLEKDLTLDIAKRLQTLASLHSDIDIVLTRDDDVGMSRQSRIETIAEQDPDLLISIHLNSLPQPNITLVETYYASETDMLLGKLRKRNIALEKAHSSSSRIDRRQRGILSHDLANLVQSAVFSTVQSHNPRAIDAGVKNESLFVLTGSNVPAVLIEMTCLSNAEEASRLETESYRTELAETLMRAIRQFADKHNQTDKLALKQLDKAA